ncbi:MAG: autotransporter-associated beta strand repeat-containing protein [Rhizobiales bacterium]|nr:autotransporter-associated beta strand repeat-containing protein [Hyphomicrobiales bacterium]
MGMDRRPAQSAISHRRTALLASSALVRVGLAVATVSGTLALLTFAGAVPAVAAGAVATGGAGGAPGGGAGGDAGADGTDTSPGTGGSAGTSLSRDGQYGVSGAGGGGGYSPSVSGDITASSEGGKGGGGGDSGGGGGGGGGGGNGANVVSVGPVVVSAAVTGGAGGDGGVSIGGGGGGGGAGIDMQSASGLTVNASVTGGAGGHAGSGGGGGGGGGGSGVVALAHPVDVTISTTGSVIGGNGAGFGHGGAGLTLSSGGTVTNAGSIVGGAGAGPGGASPGTGAGGDGAGGAPGGDPSLAGSGVGGAGIVGAGLTVINGGTITGGNGYGGQANANTFTGGANTLRFLNGTSGLNGNIGVAGSLTFDQSGTDTAVANMITGTGSVAKTGSAMVTLSGANTYTGGTAINAGILSISSDANLGAASGALTFNGGTLQKTGGVLSTARNVVLNSGGGTFDFQNLITITGNLTGTGGLTVTNSLGGSGGTLSLNGNNTYFGATHIAQGVISAASNTALSANSAYQLDSGTALVIGGAVNATVGSLAGSGQVKLNDPFTFQAGNLTTGFDNTSTTFSGIVAGAGSLTKTGIGTLTLSGANTYTGGTTIDAGTLTAASDSAFGTGLVTLDGGTLSLTGTRTLGNAIDLSKAGTIRFSTGADGTLTSDITTNGKMLTLDTPGTGAINGNIVGSTSLISKTGSGALTVNGVITGGGAGLTVTGGTLVLNHTNTYGGNTILTHATLVAGADQAFSTSRLIVQADGAVLSANKDVSFNNAVDLWYDHGLTVDTAGHSIAMSGVIRNQGGGTPGGLAKSGAGILTLSGANTYTGGTTIAGGTLRVENNSALGSGAVTTTGSVLDYADGITLNNPIVIDSNTTQLQVLAGIATQAGAISELNGPRPLEKIGAGALTLSSVNTYTGGTMVSQGILSANVTGALGTGPVTINPTVAAGVIFAASASAGSLSINLANARSVLGFIDHASAGDATIISSGNVGFAQNSSADHATLINNTGGRVDISGLTSGGMSIGSLSGGGAVFLGAKTLTLGGLGTNDTIGGVIQDGGGLSGGVGGGLIKTGAGTLTLSGVNTYTGDTTISGGTLRMGAENVLASSAGVSVNNGTWDLAGYNQTVKGLNGNPGTGVTLGSATLTVDNAANSAYWGGISGSGGVTKTGGATFILLGNNTYSGTTNIAGGVMKVGPGASLRNSSAINISNGAKLGVDSINALSQATAVGLTGAGSMFATSTDQQIGSLAGDAGTNVWLDPGVVLTTGANNTNTVFGGNLGVNGGGSLTKIGTGSFTLNGTNDYTGATTVNGGTLSVNGSIASSWLTTVNPGGTLGGNGTVGNTMIDGGILAPGNSIGTLTVAGNLVMTAASAYMVEVSPTASDFTHVTGTATLGGATVAAQFAAGTYVEKRYTILTADGGVNGTFSGPVNTNLPTNFKSALAHDGNNAYLDLSLNFVVPSGLNVNQQNVANTLVNFFNSTGGIPLAFGALDPRGLSLASGEIATTASQAAFDAQSQFLNTLTDPFTAGGQGAAGSSATPQAPLGYAATNRARKPHEAFASLVTKAPQTQTFEQRWRTFGAAYGGNTQIGGNATLGSHDAISRVYGAMGGASYALSPATQLGFAFGGGGTSFGLSDGFGSGRSEMFQAGVFAHHGFAHGGYLNGAFAYGWHDVTTDRAVSTGERLRGDYKAGVLSGRLEAGWRINTAWAGVTPYAAAQAISYRMPSYLEQGNGAADSFALGYAGRDVTATRSELGLRLDRTMVMGETLFTLRGRAAWAHNFDTARNAAATFQALPGSSFLVNGAAMAGDAALVSAGAEIAWRNGFALAATFEGEFSNNVTSYTGKGTLKYAW